MARCTFLLAAFLMVLCSLSSPLYGWGSATHAYIAHQIGVWQGASSLNEVYGAVLPDVFNVMFGDPYQGQLWMQTHYEFTKPVEYAEFESDKALVIGFASHNEVWGADQTAHISSIVHPGQGYVVRKQNELAAVLEPRIRLFLLLGGVSNVNTVIDEILPTVAHAAIETAVDLLISRNEDPDVGLRLAMAARTRGWSAPILLCKAYAADFAATAGTSEAVATPLIVAAESEFRLQMELYGTLLSQEDPVAALAEQGADLASLLLAAEMGIVVDIPADLMREILNTAIDIVKDDYAAELAATITYVRAGLESHGVTRTAL